MRRITVILTILVFDSYCIYSQLLSHPFLDVENVEQALSNPDQLREILREHGFVFESTKGNTPGMAIKNPLVSNAESISTEYWRPLFTENGSEILRSVSFIEWETGSQSVSGSNQDNKTKYQF